VKLLNRILPASLAAMDSRFRQIQDVLLNVWEEMTALKEMQQRVASLERMLQAVLVAQRESSTVELRFLRKLLGESESAGHDRETLLRFVRKLIASDESAGHDRETLLRFVRELLDSNGVLGEDLKKVIAEQAMIQALAERGRRQALLAQRASEEAVWAHIFRDASSGSDWLTNRQFAAGRWAVNYAYLYVLYRILNEVKPKRILDIGLGQTSRLIAQYVKAHPDTEHVVVESDPQWVEFMSSSFDFPARTRIIRLDCVFQAFQGVENVRQYKGFGAAFSGQKFDLISIDAPYAGDMPTIGRVDVVQLLPDLVSRSFAILMDDTQRQAEGAAFDVVVAKLKESDLELATGVYRSVKDFSIVTSKDYRFLTSL